MAISTEAELNRYSIAVRDFEDAQRFLCAARNHGIDSIEYEALLFAAIISYWRPFSLNEVRKPAAASVRLDIQNFGTLSEDQKKLHENCGNLRNKALAHSGYEYNPTQVRPSGVIVGGRFSLLGSSQIRGSGSVHNMDLFQQLLEKLIDSCHAMRAAYVSSLPAGLFEEVFCSG